MRLDSGIFNGSVARRFFMGKGSCFIGFHEVGVGEPKFLWPHQMPHHSSCPKQWASIVRSLVPGSEICGWMPALTISIPACWWSMGSSHGAWRKPSLSSTFGTLVWKTATSATSDYINYITKIWKLSCKVNALIFPSFRSGIVFVVAELVSTWMSYSTFNINIEMINGILFVHATSSPSAPQLLWLDGTIWTDDPIVK